MNYGVNEGKNLQICVDGVQYDRYAVKTHFVTPGEDYIEVVKDYAVPGYQEGDVISISEKIIALCQNRILYKKDIKVGFWARLLSKFVKVTPAGEAVGNVFKMQIAIILAGLPRILWAAFCSAVTKLFGKKGVFYKIAGHEIDGVDGFCDDAFTEYTEMGILNPLDPGGVCNEIYSQLGIHAQIVDANDLSVKVLGMSDGFPYSEQTAAQIIKDNPAGQGGESTPIILIRRSPVQPQKAEQAEELAGAV